MAFARVSLVFGSVLGAAFVVTAISISVAAAGCGTQESPAQQSALEVIQACENVSGGCPSNIAPTPTDMETCSEAIDGVCSGQMISFQNCVANKCTDAGFLDYGAIDVDCTGYQTAVENCLVAAGDGGTTPSGGGGVVVVTTPPRDASTRD